MPTPSYIITPAGSVVAASGGGNPVLLNNTVTWNGVVEVFGDSVQAAQYNTQLTSLIAQQVTAGVFTQDIRLPVLFAISPTSFELPTAAPATAFATTHIVITGVGFNSTTIGKIYIEDLAGGMDSNGYHLTCVFVNSTTLISDAGNSGDTNLPDGAVLLYYQDSVGFQSNTLSAISDSSLAAYPVITLT